MEYVSEALGHSDLKTTKNYFAGFKDVAKKEILDDITDFMRRKRFVKGFISFIFFH